VIVVLDSNIFVSAALSPGSPPDRLVLLAQTGAFELVLSPKLLGEVATVLLRDKFRPWLSVGQANRYVTGLAAIGRVEADPPVIPGLTRDPADDYLVTLALSVHADLLVSGDEDLLDAGLAAPPVVRASDAVERLSS
jgi:uncharacterized protein